MKIASIITTVIAIIGCLIFWRGAEGAYAAGARLDRSYEKTDAGIRAKDWAATSQGLDEVHWELKDLRVFQGIEGLGILICLPATVASLVLISLTKNRTNSTPLRTPEKCLNSNHDQVPGAVDL